MSNKEFNRSIVLLGKRQGEPRKRSSTTEPKLTTAYFFGIDYRWWNQKQYQLAAAGIKIGFQGKLFHQLMNENEDDLIKTMVELVNLNAKKNIWRTTLASRNVVDSPFIRNILFFKCVKKIISENKDENLILFFESPALQKMVGDFLRQEDISFADSQKLRRAVFLLRLGIGAIARATYFYIRGILLWIYIRSLSNRRLCPQERDVYIVRSWFTKGVLAPDGSYRDRNFGQLLDFFSTKKVPVWILPTFFNMSGSFLKSIKNLSRAPQNFIFIEQYVSPMVYLRALVSESKSIVLTSRGLTFDGQPLACLLLEAQWMRAFSPAHLEYNLVDELFREFSNDKISVKKIIYTFENNPIEKWLLVAARRYLPNTKIIGFQHSVWYKEQLSMRLIKSESISHPLPDEIIVSGKRYLEILVKSGFSESLLRLGSNLRFTDVYKISQRPLAKETSIKKNILIILNYNWDESFELLAKVGFAISDLTELSFSIKAHPLLSVQKLTHFMDRVQFPPYKWVQGSVQKCAETADLVIMGGASVTNLEMIVQGVPLVRISMDYSFDLDPLWDNYPFGRFSSSIEEIRASIERALALRFSEKEELLLYGRKILQEYFEPITDQGLEQFL